MNGLAVADWLATPCRAGALTRLSWDKVSLSLSRSRSLFLSSLFLFLSSLPPFLSSPVVLLLFGQGVASMAGTNAALAVIVGIVCTSSVASFSRTHSLNLPPPHTHTPAHPLTPMRVCMRVCARC